MQSSAGNPRRRPIRAIAAVILVAALALTVVSCGAETAVEPGAPTNPSLATDGSLVLASAPAGNLEDAVSTTQTQPSSPTLLADVPPAIVLDSPTVGATVQSPVRVTGSVAGGKSVDIDLLIISEDGAFAAHGAQAFQNTGPRVTFDQTLQYASTFAGKAAIIRVTLWVLPEGGQPGTYSYTVPIALN